MAKKLTPIYLKDYVAPYYLISNVDLTFELGEEHTKVTSRLQIEKNTTMTAQSMPLVLVGENLQLLRICCDDKVLEPSQYSLNDQHLSVANLPQAFELLIETLIEPQNNTTLMGLYKSNNMFCTQCEAEGFRRITYFLDRPDVLATYTTTIIADKKIYPVLLSNGNCVASGSYDTERHFATWHDPFKKPCYLFALVAGDLEHLSDEFTTQSGRNVALKLYVEKGDLDKTHHAMTCLKQAMRWDELNYGREYDLDIFMIVAVSDFNMGAMENKGLNIFNSKYVLANAATATDIDYENILTVVGHEYFHNWTGNRITCRDWFQLSLKEGLTVFRDQDFTRDFTQETTKRIADVNLIRTAQFSEDAGPLAHPIRPASYIEMNNFYTVTVYDKGAEVIRMIHTLLGKDNFRRGMDLYFQRHDGQAVTTDDFVQAMQDASGIDLRQFKLWYSQSGTPVITAKTHYDAAKQSYTLHLQQLTLATPDQAHKEALHIPVALGLLDKSGDDLPLQLVGEITAVKGTRVLSLTKAEQSFEFINIKNKPIVSLFRGFSAPVKVNSDHNLEELAFLLAHDSDEFNRWDAGQTLITQLMLEQIANFTDEATVSVNEKLFTAYEKILNDVHIEPRFKAQLLTLPTEAYLTEQMPIIAVDAIYHVRKTFVQQIAKRFCKQFINLYQTFHSNMTYEFTVSAVAARSLKNICLYYLAWVEDVENFALIQQQFITANNMTDQLAALGVLVNLNHPYRDTALQAFMEQWQHDNLVLDKWFALQAASILPHRLAAVQELMQHPKFVFKNPNKVRALIGTFCNQNRKQFHCISGAGYAFLTEQVLAVDTLNPQLASNLVGPLLNWKKYDKARQTLMLQQLQKLVQQVNLSKDVSEKVNKSLKV